MVEGRGVRSERGKTAAESTCCEEPLETSSRSLREKIKRAHWIMGSRGHKWGFESAAKGFQLRANKGLRKLQDALGSGSSLQTGGLGELKQTNREIIHE